jgi:hypothetical protein
MLTVTGAEFETLPPDSHGGWRVRVTVVGTELFNESVPVIAAVGDMPVQVVFMMPAGAGFVGFLVEIPPIGARLRVGYADIGLEDTPITYQPPIA